MDGTFDTLRRNVSVVLKKATAWGKHLFHHYEGGRVVHVHLGLYGTFSDVPIPMPLPVGPILLANGASIDCFHSQYSRWPTRK